MNAKKGPPVGNLRPLTDPEWDNYVAHTSETGRPAREALGADDIGCIYVRPVPAPGLPQPGDSYTTTEQK